MPLIDDAPNADRRACTGRNVVGDARAVDRSPAEGGRVRGKTNQKLSLPYNLHGNPPRLRSA